MWDRNLSPEEREQWNDFVKRAREDAAAKIDDSAFVISLVPGEPDIKFAVELGLSIMYDKPIMAVVLTDAPVPERLRRVVDEIVELENDVDTEEGQKELEVRMKAFIERMGMADE